VTWVRWFLPLLALCIAWSLAAPPVSGPDENAHVARAAALAHGDVLGEDVDTAFGRLPRVSVPRDYVVLGIKAGCFRKRAGVTPDCETPVPVDVPTEIVTGMAKYPPLPYALVGWPTRWLSASAGARAMRVLSAAFVAGFLAAAFAAAGELRRWGRLGVALAVTPMVPYYGGIVNPSGVEIASAIALWTSVVVLARAAAPPRGALWLAAVAFAVCVNTRSLSIAFALLAVAAGLLLAGQERRRELRSRRDLWPCLLLGALALAPAATWAVARGRFDDVSPSAPDFGLVDGVTRWWRLLQESTGWYGLFEVRVMVTVVLWSAVAATVVGLAVWWGHDRDRAVLGGVAIVTFIVPIAVSLAAPAPLYTVWPGRVGLPLTVGVPIVAGAVVARSKPRVSLPEWTVPLLAGILGIATWVGFVATARRYAVGADGPLAYVLDARWSVAPPGLVLAMATGAIVALAWLVALPTADRQPTT
jgi:hypothetical protein